MTTKKGKVTRVTSNGTWEGNYGLMYKFEIEMENGDVGENLSKSNECKFKEGQETDYEFIDGQFPKIKPVSTFQNNFTPRSNDPDRQLSIIRQSSLKAAIDLVVHEKIEIQELIKTADSFVEWVQGKKQAEYTNHSTDKAPF